MVESVRIGTVIASDKKALNRWRSRSGRQAAAARGGGLSGAGLERAIGALAVSHPEYVVIEAA